MLKGLVELLRLLDSKATLKFIVVLGNTPLFKWKDFPLCLFPATNDQQVFYATHWTNANPNTEIPGAYLTTAEENELQIILERGCYFYFRQLENSNWR